MTKEKINEAITEYIYIEYIEWRDVQFPDFFGDLNLMFIAEQVLKTHDEHAFACYNIELLEKFGYTVSICAADRAEMFVKIIGKWEGQE